MTCSWLPEAIVFPSGLKATDVTHVLRCSKERMGRPVFTSHSLSALSLPSSLDEASVFPSGLKATE